MGNRGEVEQYFVENSHPAIFSRELAALLDMERERRQRLGKSYNGAGIFSSRIVCGDCGGIYGPKVWYSNTKYRRTIWRCNRRHAPAMKLALRASSRGGDRRRLPRCPQEAGG